MDLKKFDIASFAEQGSVLHLKDPITEEPLHDDDDQKTPITIKLVGTDSPRFRKKQRENTDKRVARMAKNKPYTADEILEEQIDLLVHCTLGWDRIFYDGQYLEFTPKNVKFMYSQFPWIREQVDVFIGQRINFLQSSVET